VVFGGYDLTNPKYWEGYINGSIYTGGNQFTEAYLRSFSEKYECVGITTPERYITFLQKCLEWLPEETSICLILGATSVYEGEEVAKQRHRRLNDAIKAFSVDHPRIKYVELDDCVKDASDFADGINHLSARAYYELARRLLDVIQSVTGKKLESYSSSIVLVDNLTLRVRKFLKKVLNPDSTVYKKFKTVFNKVYKNRG
jgi:hypothetical protein